MQPPQETANAPTPAKAQAQVRRSLSRLALRTHREPEKHGISKAKADFDQGIQTCRDTSRAWQQAQDDYEDRIGAQTGQPVAHTGYPLQRGRKGQLDRERINPQQHSPKRSNPQTAQPSSLAREAAVSVGDPVNVNGRKGTISGFNPANGKAQVKWEAAQ